MYQQLPKWECVNLARLLDDKSSIPVSLSRMNLILSACVFQLSHNSLTVRGDADNSVACGLWLGRHDAQLLADNGIDQSGLARVGLRSFTEGKQLMGITRAIENEEQNFTTSRHIAWECQNPHFISPPPPHTHSCVPHTHLANDCNIPTLMSRGVSIKVLI